VALEQFRQWPARLETMRERDRLYRDLLSGLPGIKLPRDRSNEGEVCQWFDILSEHRREIIGALDAAQAGCRSFWLPLHRQLPYGMADSGFERAVGASECGLWLPSRPNITAMQ